MRTLSATIVAYNNYNEIKQALSSIEKYTSADKKIYVVDNGVAISKEEDVSDFGLFLQRYEDVEYINSGKNLGFGKGHNYVISRLDSKYHALVNPDILFIEDSFSKIINYMDNREDVGAVIPLIINEKGEMQLVYRENITLIDMFIRMFCWGLFPNRVAKHTMQNRDYTKEFEVPFGQGSFLVFRTELFKRLHGFDDNFFMYVEDADLCKRLNQISKLMYFPGTKVIHRWEKGSHRNKALFKYHVESMRYYFNKWGWKVF